MTRRLLGSLLMFGALNAAAGGVYGVTGAEAVPPEWLAGSPFTSYLVPGLVLLVVVGGTLLYAAIGVFRKAPDGRGRAVAAGVILLGWIVVQVAIIGYVSWLQPATVVAGLLVLLLAWQLPAQVAARSW